MLKNDSKLYTDTVISDFSDARFQTAFQRYFSELGVSVRDWDGLFREMDSEGDNAAIVRTAADGETVGFIQFKPIRFTSSFFEETCGFIREFWVDGAFRNRGCGTALLRLAENWFVGHGIYTSILTTDTAANFYQKRGYVRARGCKARNKDDVYIKHLEMKQDGRCP